MRVPVTPPPNLEGVFKIGTPFSLTANVVYRVEAIRTFPDLVREGIDIYSKFYQPKGLEQTEYLADADVGAAIITFKSRDGEVVYIPDTYVESYPGVNGVNYSRYVFVGDLSLVPDTLDVTFLPEMFNNLVMAYVGVNAHSELTQLSYEGIVTEEQHQQMEAVRRKNITSNTSVYQENDQLKARNAALETLTAQMAEILKKK